MLIPNKSEVVGPAPNQSRPDSRNFDILTTAIAANGIISGGVVTAHAGTMGVDVTAFRAKFAPPGGALINVAGSAVTNLLTTASDPTNPRIDLVVVSSAGVVSIIQGTPVAVSSTTGPTFPSRAAIGVDSNGNLNRFPIARIDVRAGVTSLASTDVLSLAVYVPGTQLDLIAPSTNINTATFAMSAGFDAYPFTLQASSAITPPPPIAGQWLTISFIQDATGNRVPTLTGVRWSGGAVPTWSTAAGMVDEVRLYCLDGTHWDGFILGMGMAVPTVIVGTFVRPFAADSLYYRPVSAAIAAGAIYGRGSDLSTNAPGFTAARNGYNIDITWILQGKSTYPSKFLWTTNSWNPPRNVGGSSTGILVQIDPTLDIPYDSGIQRINSAGGYLTPDGTTWYEGNAIEIDPAGSTPYFGNVLGDPRLTTPAIAMSGRGTYGGKGASRLSSVAGACRSGEMEGTSPAAGPTGPAAKCSIDHVILFTAPMAFWGRGDVPPTYGGVVMGGATSTQGPPDNSNGGYHIPAWSADSGFTDNTSANFYGGSMMWMGSLLAIRPQDYSTIRALMATNQGKNMVDCLTVYGGYVSENSASPPGTGYEVWSIGMENQAAVTCGLFDSGGVFLNSVKADWDQILPFLYVVRGNNPPT